MKVAIRKEQNNRIYIDKNLRLNIDYTSSPYNFTIIEIDDVFSDVCEQDFNLDFSLNIEKYNARKEQEQILPQIDILKKQLNSTDYQAIKFAEGVLSNEEYSQTKINRANWRKEINNLEERLQILNTVLNQ